MLFQALIAFAVGSAAIYWQWTPNGVLIGLMSMGAALGATVAVNALIRAFNSLIGRPTSR